VSSMDYAGAPPTYDEDAPPRRSAHAPRIWAGAVLLLAGLGLILLAGCFLIGAVVIANPDFFNPSPAAGPPAVPSWDAANIFLFTALNILALACCVSAAIVFVVGFLGLYRILFNVVKPTA
jgi:hypothetical protein